MTVQSELQTLNARFTAALSSKNLDETMDYYDKDVSFLMTGLPAMEGADAVRAYYTEVFKSGLESASMDTKRVEESGGLILEHGEYVMNMKTEEGAPIANTGKYLVVLRQNEEGQWKCWWDMFQPDSI